MKKLHVLRSCRCLGAVNPFSVALVIFMAGLLAGSHTWAEKTISKDRLDYRGDLFFETGSDVPFTGNVVDYHPTGEKKWQAHYTNGKRDGLVVFYMSGQKKSEGHYKDERLDGLYTEWYADGRKRSEANYKNGKKDGLYTEWFSNGQKKVEAHFKDGKRDGAFTEWYENGQKKFEGRYKNRGLVFQKRYPPQRLKLK